MMKYTIKTDVQARIKVLRSEFIGFLYRVEDAGVAQEILRKHQNDYQNATHNCYAYVLGYDAETQYYSDAGEPGGTVYCAMIFPGCWLWLPGIMAVSNWG